MDNNNSIDRDDNKLGTEFNGKEACPSSKCVASVASVADIHNDAVTSTRSTTGLPVLSCLWCDYKHHIEFDLGNHLLADHKEGLLKLLIGKGLMDDRTDYAIQSAKRMMASQYEDDGDGEQEDEDIA